MQRQAWYTWMASTNRPMFGQERFTFKPFDELFPTAKKPEPPSIDPELTEKICTAHRIKLLE